jgi:hypothetical protein
MWTPPWCDVLPAIRIVLQATNPYNVKIVEFQWKSGMGPRSASALPHHSVFQCQPAFWAITTADSWEFAPSLTSRLRI